MRSPKARDQGPRERPILFNETMVRRLLDGRKTQSRRPLSAQPAPNRPHDGGTVWRLDPRTGRHVPYGSVSHLTAREKMGICCPYSLPGDRLWVRETWCQRKDQALYRADGDVHGPWRPAIHMPRSAARILLVLTAVRIERLHTISEDDTVAEGVTPTSWISSPDPATHRERFTSMWQSIYGATSWSANPWVWVLSFQRADRDPA